MPARFIPSREADMVPYFQNMSALITASPSTYGLVAGQATVLAGLVTGFVNAYNTAVHPATRTTGAVATKNEAKRLVIANVRLLARIVQATPTVTPTMKIDLGLTPRDGIPSPVPVPDEAPVLEVISVFGRQIKVRVRGVETDRRGKPEGVAGASFFSFVGTTPPADIAQWKWEGSTTRTFAAIDIATTVPAGSQVFLTAFWFNTKSNAGPACTPISTYIAGGVALAA